MQAQLEETRGQDKGACRVHTGPTGCQELGLQEAESRKGPESGGLAVEQGPVPRSEGREEHEDLTQGIGR